ncbi:DUF1801 domain-containing protein [Leptospira sarikeiensis]|uniref:DUF1801 domain-containing protein n=1 Tax=Leptospira sarikeiensis TaxID=2484943 RepID=A0A4R9K4C9_9LEPT|nr:DUF1801 domain-containing protein [Leptospira sarikeiensis]TGL60966.1 DUF1801 domain-containing protein [Leptospira sarikeiensis]
MVSKKSQKDRNEQEIISDILRPHSKKILEIVKSLRTKILNMFPDFEERGYPVWKAIGFRDKNLGYLCGIFPFEDKVRLVFEWGILLKDHNGILLGETKQIRYMDFISAGEIDFVSIGNFIDQSLDLPKSKKDKELLIEALHLSQKPVSKKRKS